MATVFQDGFVHLSDVSAAPNVAKMFFADVKEGFTCGENHNFLPLRARVEIV